MLDLSIVIAYLVLVLTYGLYRGRNIKTFKDYAVGNRNFTNIAIVATIAATLIGGGSTINYSRIFYSFGIICILGPIFEFIQYWITAKWFVPKFIQLAEEEDAMTIGDVLKHYFGEKSKFLAGCVATLLTVGALGGQIAALGFVFQYFFGISYALGASLAFSILVIYSATGGIKSVVATDIIQFFLLVVAVPLIASVAIYKAGGLGQIIEAVPTDHWSFFPDWETAKRFWPVYLAFCIPTLNPKIGQRILMSRDVKATQRSLMISSFLVIPTGLVVLLISFSAIVLFPSISDTFLIFPTVIDELLPIGVKGFAIAGLLAIIMSTADSILNSGAVAFVHDVLKPLKGKDTIDELKTAKIFTFVVGGLALLVALTYKDIFDILRIKDVFWDAALGGPIIVLMLLRYRPSLKAFSGATAITLVLAIITTIYDERIGFSCLVPLLTLNITLLLTYDRKNLKKREKKTKAQEPLLKRLQTGLKRHYKTMMVMIGEQDGFLRGLFISSILVYIVFYYVIGGPIISDWQRTDLDYILPAAGAIALLLLLLAEIWPKNLLKHFSFLWLLTAAYSISFLSAYFLIKSEPSIVGGINFLLCQVTILLFFNWRASVVLSFLGVLAATLLCSLLAPQSFDIKVLSILSGGLAFVAASAISIMRSKEDIQREKEDTLISFSGILAHELRTPLLSAQSCSITANRLIRQGKLTDPKAIADLEEAAGTTDRSLQSANNFINMSLSQIKGDMQTSIEKLDIHNVLSGASERFALSPKKAAMIDINLSGPNFTFEADRQLFDHVLFNLIKNALQALGGKKREKYIEIWTEEGPDHSLIHIKDYGPGIPLAKQDKVFEKFYSQKTYGTGLGLAFCKTTMQRFGGSISLKSIPGKYTTFTLKFTKSG